MSASTTRRGRTGLAAAVVGTCLTVLMPSPAVNGHPPSDSASQRSVGRDAFVMGTRVTLVTYDEDRAAGLARLESLLQVLERTDDELSTWRDDSLLSRFNGQPIDQPFPLDSRSCRLFGQLRYWWAETGGAFDPGIGPLIAAWDLRGRGREPDKAALEAARRSSGLDRVAVDRSCTARRLSDTWIDSGAFGKGEALDRAHQAPGHDGAPWMIDLGGQVIVHGSPPGRDGWIVGLAHPERRQEVLLDLTLETGSVAVSGGSERDLRIDTGRIGHVLDPRTGRPAGFEGAVAVWHASALAADVLSTALYVLGPSAGLAWAEARGIAACFLIPAFPETNEPGVTIASSEAFRRRFRLDPQGSGTSVSVFAPNPPSPRSSSATAP